MPPFDLAALARLLAAAAGAERVEITAPTLLAGGAIRENWGFTALFTGGSHAGAQPLVLRTDGATGIAASLSRPAEFAVLQAVFAAGVTVPEPLFSCPERAVIGKPFFVMRRVPGTAQGREITTDPALQPLLPHLANRLGRELARLQAIRPPRDELAFLPTVGPAQHIAGFRAYLDRHPNPRPVLEWAIRWLERHVPEPLPPVLCHRDFRTGNYMLAPTLASAGLPHFKTLPLDGGGLGGGDRADSPLAPAQAASAPPPRPSPIEGEGVEGSGWGLTGILDWEFAGWGDPDEDIGWFCCKGWRFARLDREAGGIAARAPFYEGYEAAAGRRLDPERVHFWEVLANVRWAVIALQQSDRHLLGGARDLAIAIIGRRARECELELLMLLDRGGFLPRSAGEVASDASRRGQRGAASPLHHASHGPPPPPGGGGSAIRDVPSGAGLLALGRELLLDELLPLLPPEWHRDLRLATTAMAIAEREAAAGDAPAGQLLGALSEFYAGHAGRTPTPTLPRLRGREKGWAAAEKGHPPPQAGEGRVGVEAAPITSPQDVPLDELLRRLAADLRAGAFEVCEARERAARAILWSLTIMLLREGNPQFLAQNGFGD